MDGQRRGKLTAEKEKIYIDWNGKNRKEGNRCTSTKGEQRACQRLSDGRYPRAAVNQVPRAHAPACALVRVAISEDRPRVSRSANLSGRRMEAGPADWESQSASCPSSLPQCCQLLSGRCSLQASELIR